MIFDNLGPLGPGGPLIPAQYSLRLRLGYVGNSNVLR